MKKPKRGAKAPLVQPCLFSDMAEEKAIRPSVVPLDFESHSVRMVLIKGEPWWVGPDVCRAMKIPNASHAINGQERRRKNGKTYWSGGLQDDEKGIHAVNTIDRGPQEMLVVNEAGLWKLVFKSQTKEAERFKRWLAHDVLPALRKHGFYSLAAMANTKVAKTARRLKIDPEAAIHRVFLYDINRLTRERILSEGGCVNDIVACYNGPHLGHFGSDAAGLRERLGLKPWETPQNHMSPLVMASFGHSKAMAERMISESREPIQPSDQSDIFVLTAREMTQADLARLGPDHALGIRDDKRRGKIIDVVRTQLAG